MAKTNYTLYGKLYGNLVLVGRRVLKADSNPDNLPVIPAKYYDETVEYLEWYASRLEEIGK